MNNLFKRIITSTVLLFIFLIGLFYNKYSLLFLIILVSFISFYEFSNLVKKIWNKDKLTKLLINFIIFIYLIIFSYLCFQIGFYEKIIFLFFLSICFFSDIGGYVIGKTIAGKKLTKISPNKTISGSVGSFLFSLIPLWLFNSFFEFGNITYLIQMILFCLFLSFISQAGDIFVSSFKRKAKVKDTGKILPGHGGLLDRIDGVLFAIPFASIIYKLIFSL